MILKRTRVRTLILAMLLVCMVLVPAASAKNPSDSKVETYGIKGLDANKVKEIEARASYIKSLPDTIQNAPYMGLVTADDETKKAVLGHIDNLSISDSEKNEMKNEMEDIWSRVPDKITEDDYPVIQKIGDAVTKYVEDTYLAGMQSPKWGAKAHSGLISAGVKLVYKDSTKAKWAADAAPLPDSLDTGVDRYFFHYYNPAYNQGYGGAPGKCLYYTQYAKDYYAAGQFYNAFYNLGLASHYLSDVGNPMHSGGEVSQGLAYLLGNSYHTSYESYVESNWGSGCKYSQYPNNNAGIKSVTSPSQAVKDLAAYSNPYFSTLWGQITAHPSNFNTSTTQYVTAKVLLETAKYNAGLARYIKS